MPSGRRGWFVAGSLHPRLRVQPRPKVSGFFMMQRKSTAAMSYVRNVYTECKKDPQSVCLEWMFSTKIKSRAVLHPELRCLSREETGCKKLSAVIGIHQ
ncbi:hypothetical protein TNCV_3221341 [Trichonephila clavipes]|nr:hypothetical protein TNCV_3221341 [Trichonephila clavipes]